MPSSSKILLVANSSWYIYNFRFPLLRSLRSSGYNVQLVAPFDRFTPHLEREGFTVHNWDVSRSSINPFAELKALFNLYEIYQREAPNLVHHFTIKACLYGTISAKLVDIPFVLNAITGLGHVFLGTRKRNRILRKALIPLYRQVLGARRSTVIFQNNDDKLCLTGLGIADDSRAELIRGSGVDVSYFDPDQVSNNPSSNVQLISVDSKLTRRVLFPSRLIAEKGFRELIQACSDLWNAGTDFHLLVAGSIDDGNRSSLTFEELTALRIEKRIQFLGHVDDMRKLYATSDLLVLPSWREGLSRSLIEAASMEKPIITTDVPGCRDVVDHGRTGLLVPVRDHHALRLAIQLLLDRSDLAFQLGVAARIKVVEDFEVSLVNDRTLHQYRKLLPN